MIDGHTEIIAHLGYPTHSFKAPMIYNPYFEKNSINAVVVPMGVKADNYRVFVTSLFKLSNVRGALVTMPHKMTTVGFVDEVSTTARIAGACNAIRATPDGRLFGDMFDGEGFVRGLLRKDCMVSGSRALVVGAGGVGSAIAASLAKAGVASLGLYDQNSEIADRLGRRLMQYYPQLHVALGERDPSDFDIVVNATPLGMNEGDALPLDVDRIKPTAFVGEVVMKQTMTPFLQVAKARGCRTQIGLDMLFEQIPAYLEFFGFPTTTAKELRAIAKV